MASISRRGDVWRARFRGPDDRERARHFDRKVDAQRWLDEQTAAIVTGTYVDPKAGRETVGEHAARWRATLVHRPNYLRVIDNALANHIVPAFGDRPLSTLRRSDVQGFVATLSERLAPNSVHNMHRVLAQLMAAAVDDRKIAVSPCVRIKLPSRPSVEVAPPTPGELAALVAATPDRYAALVVLLAGTRLRISEALGLEVGDVNFLHRKLQVSRQRDPRTNLPAPTKTKASVRSVPLGQVVVDVLAAHLATYPPAEDGSIFADDRGRPLTYERWKPVWKATGSTFKTHDLRHYAASALIAGGASVKRVQSILGHTSPAVTLGVYSHLWPDDDDRARTILDAALADCVRTEGVVG
jgi:integrase